MEGIQAPRYEGIEALMLVMGILAPRYEGIVALMLVLQVGELPSRTCRFDKGGEWWGGAKKFANNEVKQSQTVGSGFGSNSYL
jgi:hypothetical protein